MKRQSLAKNFVFQFLYQALIMILPLVLSPYLTRTLKETALGTYTYVNSIAYYFFLVCNLGIAKYGQRLISQSVGDEKNLRKSFWSLFVLHIIISFIAIVAYVFFIHIFVQNDRDIYYLHIIYLMFALVDVSWFFYGIENIRNVVTKNIIVKISEFALIFWLVKTPKDLPLYTIIVNGGLLLGALILIPAALKIAPPIRFNKKELLSHVKPMALFSISVIAVSLYTIFDKTLLGLLTNKENVAFYEYAYRIDRVPVVITSVVGTVMFPRACRMAKEGNTEAQKRYFDYSIVLISAISMGALFGILAVAKQLAAIYYGKSFAICGDIMIFLSPLIYIISVGEILRTQYLIPNGHDKEYVRCLVYNAVINIAISASLIPFMGINGAVIGTTVAEAFGLGYQALKCRRYIKIKDVLVPSISFIIIGFLMFCIVKLVGGMVSYSWRGLLIQVVCGIVSYGAASLLYLRFFKNNMFNEFKSKLIR